MALPPEIAGHLNLDGPPVEPRPSATVVLAREGDPWELLLVHRPGGADFAPGAYVFPGGAVHEEDRSLKDEIRAAAVREVFEETGILLVNGAVDSDCSRLRSAIDSGESFWAAMKRQGAAAAFDDLVPFARWITPAQLRRRFDARFFVARVPAGQSVHPQEGEVTDWQWTPVRRALDSHEVTLVYATRAVLESLAGISDVEELMGWARGLKQVPLVEPRIVETSSGWQIVRD